MTNLRVIHRLDSGLVSRTQRSKADENVSILVLGHGVTHVLVHREENLVVSPVELLLVIAGEWVDHGSNAWLRPRAHEIEVQHALNSSVLHPPNDGLCFAREQILVTGFCSSSRPRSCTRHCRSNFN